MALLTRIGLAGVGQRSLGTRTLHGYWKVPTTAAAGVSMHMLLLQRVVGTTYVVAQQGDVVVADGYASLQANFGAPGNKCMAHLDNWDGDTNTAVISGGPGIATYSWT